MQQHTEYAQWDAFVMAHPHKTIFQHPDMWQLYHSAEDISPITIFSYDEYDDIDGVLLATVYSSPHIMSYFTTRVVIYGGPLIQANPEHCYDAILNLLMSELLKKIPWYTLFVQIRNFTHNHQRDKSMQALGFKRYDRLNIINPISESTNLGQHIFPARKRQIKAGKKEGLVVREAANEQEVLLFYQQLKQRYIEIRKPLPEYSFFNTFFKISKSNLLGKIWIVEKDGLVHGGMVCPITPLGSCYEWYICNDKSIRNSGAVLTSEVLRNACNIGCTQFDFMGAGLPGKSYGVRQFKRTFGGATENFGRYNKIHNRVLYTLAELGYTFRNRFQKYFTHQ